MPSPIAIDFEAYYDAEYSLTKLTYEQYVRHPKFDPYLVSVCDGMESWAGHPRDLNPEALRGRDLVSHNSVIDEEVTIEGKRRGLFDYPFDLKRWYCTLNMSAYLFNVRSLKDASQLGLGVEIGKEVRDRAKGKRWSDMVSEGWSGEMLSYACSDAHKCWALWDKHSEKWPLIERRLSRLTIDQGRFGVAIDAEGLQAGIALLQKVIFNAEANLPWVERGRKPGSPIGCAEQCRMVGIPHAPVKADDPEAAEAWEEAYWRQHPFVRALRNVRKAKKTLATLNTIQGRLREDSTVSFSLKYCGTAPTFRWAGEGGWNLQSQNKEPLFVDSTMSFVYDMAEQRNAFRLFEVEQVGRSACGTLSNGLQFLDPRGLIVARSGKKIVSVDLAQIEPRVLNYLAGNQDFIRLVSSGQSPYEAHARTRMGWQGGDLKKQEPKVYAYSKERVISLGYGCGSEKFRVRAKANEIDIDADDEMRALEMATDGKIYGRWRTGIPGKMWRYTADAAEKYKRPVAKGDGTSVFETCIFVTQRRGEKERLICLPVAGCAARWVVNDFRSKEPGITGLWADMDEAFRGALGTDLAVKLPNGSTMLYRDVRKSKRDEIDDETGETYEKTVFTARVGLRRRMYYGGKIVENICQATARHVFAEGTIRIDDAGHRSLFTEHDADVLEVDESVDEKELERLMGQTPEWLPGCPIAAEAKSGKRFKK